MTEQHWIKYYRIDPKNIKDDGTIDDDTPLYPFYDDFMKWYDNSCTQRDIINCLGDRL